MRAIVLGAQSFIDGGTKVGSQYLAQALAAAGWQVDYLPTLSSPLDVIGRKRHARMKRAWGGDAEVIVEAGLAEWTARAPFPAHRWFLRQSWQLRAYGALLPQQLKTTCYDLCLADVAPNLLLLEHLRARVYVCRLNDWPQGFARDLHPVVIRALEAALRGPRFAETWAVSRALAAYSRELNPRANTVWLPNGVDVALLPPRHADSVGSAAGAKTVDTVRQPRSAIYVGGMTPWMDGALLAAVARLMPDWTFDIYGPGGIGAPDDPTNLHYCGSLSREALPGVLRRYQVGLIPFRDADNRMHYVERPLKFYEYIVAGLGVASTDLGALREGMGDLAHYGNGAEGFALAINNAARQATLRPPEFAAHFVQEHGWPARAQTMLSRLSVLLPERS